MRRALVISLVWSAVFSAGDLVSAERDDALRHPSIREVLLMTNGGVAYDVMVERVRRMREVPALDAAAIATLTSKGVPAKVLLELVPGRKAVTTCEIPERKVEVRKVLDHPSIREVLRQVDAGATTDAIVERVGHLQSVPALDARAIVKLTSKGVPDKALLELVRKPAPPADVEVAGACLPATAEPTEKQREVSTVLTSEGTVSDGAREVTRTSKEDARSLPHRHGAAVAGSGGMGRIRVVAQSSLPVTYLEVLLDGDPVTRKGEVQEGETKPGWILPPPPVLDVKKGAVVFESDVPVGPYAVQTTFALSRIVETDWDAVVEARGQRYDTAKAGPAGEKGEVPVCEVREGRTCVVLARLLKKGDRYAVAYDSKMR